MSHTQLTQQQRYQIYALKKMGHRPFYAGCQAALIRPDCSSQILFASFRQNISRLPGVKGI